MAIVIGIDLGTSNIAFSYVENNEAKIIPNHDGYNITPSIIALGDDVLIGRAAKRQQQLNPKTTIYSSKRFIGRLFSEALSSKKMVNYDIIEDQQGECTFLVENEEYTPQEIAATLLLQLKKQMELYLQEEITQAVITVPAYFNDRMRQATKDAGMLAGLDVLRIINEPTAAALAYSRTISGRKKILVYDFGGGTFDVSLVEMENDFTHVQATRGDNALGGNDIDFLLTNYICDNFHELHGVDLRQDPISFQRVQDEAERIKCELSSTQSSSLYLPFIYSDIEKGTLNLEMKLSRKILETLIGKIIETTIIECKKTLEDGNLDPADLDEIILVGGSSRIPLIHERLQQTFSCPLNSSVNPDEVIAMGAAIQADMLAGSASQSIVLLDVTPFSLGIEEKGGLFKPLIHRNSLIPIEVRKKATTVVDNQRTIKIHVLQGESPLAIENHSLGEFELTDIAPASRGVPKIDIQISLDSNGLVKVSATDTRSGRKEEIQIERSNILSAEEIQKSMKKISKNSSTSPKDIKQEIRQRLDLLLQFVEKHKESIDTSYKKRIKELQYRGTVIVQKTDQMPVLHKLLLSINSIHSDLLERVRPKISE